MLGKEIYILYESKALIAVTPNGCACFIPYLYEGSIDDVAITEKGGILNYIEPGDLLFVDKGFTIHHLLRSKQATIKIPAFWETEEDMLKKRIWIQNALQKHESIVKDSMNV